MSDAKAVEDAIERAVLRVSAGLVDDPVFVSAITAREVARLVRIGELVPRSKMRVGDAFEIVAVGRVAEIEAAAREVIANVERVNCPDSLLVAIRELEAVLDGAATDEPEPPKPPKKKAPAKKAAAAPEPDIDDDIDDEGADEPGSEGEPVGSAWDPRPCARCGVEKLSSDPAVDEIDQALRSWTRWRVVLCTDCHQIGPKAERVA